MKHPATRELFAYWNELRGERTAPQRCEIDPAAIRQVLADTFMLDVDARASYPIRLAGTRVNALFDVEQKGRSFLDAWRPQERRNVAAVLLTVTDGACAVVAGGLMTPDLATGAQARDVPGAADAAANGCAFELLLLPLRHYGKTHSRILGMIKPATATPWLGVLPVGALSLRSLRIINDAESEVRASPAAVWQDGTGLAAAGLAAGGLAAGGLAAGGLAAGGLAAGGLAAAGLAAGGLAAGGLAAAGLATPGLARAGASRPYLRLIQGGL